MIGNILVGYASGSGSTAEVAEAIGEVLRVEGVTADVCHVNDVTDVRVYSAVVLGSSIRAGRWLPEAVDFLATYREDLEKVPVAYFTTCLTMVNDTEESRRTVLAYMEPVLQLARRIEPVGLGLFAGSLSPSMRMVVPGGPYGDFRDWEAIRAWTERIRPALLEGKVRSGAPLVLGQAILSYSDMSGVNLSDADLHGAELQETKLRKAILTGTDLRYAVLTKADLRHANLREASLGWADLNDCDLQGADLRKTNLVGAALNRADLSQANLSQAVLNGASLNEAILVEANLAGADLNWADLSGAYLSQANLSESNLGWADLSGAILDQADLTKARYNEQTKWPEGFSAETAGCVLVTGPH